MSEPKKTRQRGRPRKVIAANDDISESCGTQTELEPRKDIGANNANFQSCGTQTESEPRKDIDAFVPVMEKLVVLSNPTLTKNLEIIQNLAKEDIFKKLQNKVSEGCKIYTYDGSEDNVSKHLYFIRI